MDYPNKTDPKLDSHTLNKRTHRYKNAHALACITMLMLNAAERAEIENKSTAEIAMESWQSDGQRRLRKGKFPNRTWEGSAGTHCACMCVRVCVCECDVWHGLAITQSTCPHYLERR